MHIHAQTHSGHAHLRPDWNLDGMGDGYAAVVAPNPKRLEAYAKRSRCVAVAEALGLKFDGSQPKTVRGS